MVLGNGINALDRPDYEGERYLTSTDLFDEQRNLLQRLRRTNQYLHGWGIVCGLRVVPGSDPRRPWLLHICPGYALDPCGNEILVPESTFVDVRDYLWLRPLAGRAIAPVAYVAIKYAEELRRPVPQNDPLCGCNEPQYQYSRIRDATRVDVLWTPPPPPGDSAFDLCADLTLACPAPPSTPYVYLATVTLLLSEADPITTNLISNL